MHFCVVICFDLTLRTLDHIPKRQVYSYLAKSLKRRLRDAGGDTTLACENAVQSCVHYATEKLRDTPTQLTNFVRNAYKNKYARKASVKFHKMHNESSMHNVGICGIRGNRASASFLAEINESFHNPLNSARNAFTMTDALTARRCNKHTRT